jgi:hypothetical protein
MRSVRTVRSLTILTPGDPGRDDTRRARNLAADQHPAAIALARTTQDVVTAVRFARLHGLRIAAQSTGHNAALLGPLEDTVLIRTRALRQVSVDPLAGTAWAQAGVRWQEVSDAAGRYGLAGLAGSSPSVGVVGYTLGGGLSWLGRSYGLSANNVEAFELVTADGDLVRADPFSEPDLFWALRGGGGSFGVVTGIELRLFPVRDVYAGQLWWPADAGRRMLPAWRDLTCAELPDELTTTVRYLNFPSAPDVPDQLRGGSFAVVDVIHLGSPAEADELLVPLRELRPFRDTLDLMPVPELGYLHGDPEHPVPVVADGALLASLPAEAVDEIIRLAGSGASSPPFAVELRNLGAELGYARPGNGAVPALPASHLLLAAGLVQPPEAAAAVQARIGAVMSAVSPWTARQGSLNLAGSGHDPASFWSPQAYARLRAIKAAVDPLNVIHADHPIPPEAEPQVPAEAWPEVRR